MNPSLPIATQLVVTQPTHPSNSQSFAADSLALGMVVMLAMTIIQRGVGFFRGIWICRMLDDTDVGQWAMAFGFILLITPVMMLGVPGSIPRYAEHFRARGHLRAFVRRLALMTFAFTLLFFAAAFALPNVLAWFIFLKPQNANLIYSVSAAVGAVSAFYFVNELLSGLRQVRAVSVMQFVQSVSFTIIALTALYLGYGLIGIILSFAIASVIALAPGLAVLRRGWSGLPQSQEPFEAPSMWRRVLPFAAALWAMNLLTNVFDLSDRYMILHFTPGDETLGQAAVGQYHSGRIIPELVLSLGAMISGVLMSYLSADWEHGKRQAVRDRMRRVLLMLSAFCTLGSAIALLFAPWMYGSLLQGRYNDGLALMPMAFVFCSWAALAVIAQTYLLVVERGKLIAIATGVGLTANVALNALLLPLWGLHGAVVATLCAHGIVMLGVFVAMAKSDFQFDRTIVYVSLLPATILAGPWVAIICVIVCIAASQHARAWLHDSVVSFLAKRRNTAMGVVS